MSGGNVSEPSWMGHVWYDPEGFDGYCIYAPEDQPRIAILAEIASGIDGITLEGFTLSEMDALTSALTFVPLRSVIASDRDQLGDDFDWHSEASGRRVRPCWSINRGTYRRVVDSADARSALPKAGR